MSNDLCYLTAVNAITQFQNKTLSPVKLMQAIIARTEEMEPQINAFSFTYFDEALEAAKEAVWGRLLLSDLGFEQKEPTVIRVDNQSAISFSENDGKHSRTKHIGMRVFFLREQVAKKVLSFSRSTFFLGEVILQLITK